VVCSSQSSESPPIIKISIGESVPNICELENKERICKYVYISPPSMLQLSAA